MKKCFTALFFALFIMPAVSAQNFAEISAPKEMRIYGPCKHTKFNGKKMPKKYTFACNNKTSTMDIKAPSGELFVNFEDPGYKYLYIFFRLENRAAAPINFDLQKDIKLYAIEKDGTEVLLKSFTDKEILNIKEVDAGFDEALKTGGLKKYSLLPGAAAIEPSNKITGGVFFDRHIAYKYKLLLTKGNDYYELIFAPLSGFKKGLEKVFNNPTNTQTIYVYR